MVIVTKKQTKPRAENDFYPTPFDLAEAIAFEKVGFFPHNVLDPGCGDGVFGYAVRSYTDNDPKVIIHGIDIVGRKWKSNASPYNRFWKEDFVTWDWLDGPYDLIIGNPPYSDAESFIRKSMDVVDPTGGKIIFLLKLAFLESKKRARGLFKEFPPTEVSVLAGRPSFDGTGKTNDYAFAVFIWDMRAVCYGGYNPVITWLDWS